jgi:hypothetical protein
MHMSCRFLTPWHLQVQMAEWEARYGDGGVLQTSWVASTKLGHCIAAYYVSETTLRKRM